MRDFFEEVNGSSLESVIIPADHSSWGISEEISRATDLNLKEILETTDSAASTLFKSGQWRNLRGKDMKRHNRRAIEGMKKDLDRVVNFSDPWSCIAFLNVIGCDSPLMWCASPDIVNRDLYINWLCSGGIGLSEKGHYTAPTHKETRGRYREYIREILESVDSCCNILEEYGSAVEAANDIFEVESLLASKMLTPEEDRHTEKHYSPYDDPDRLERETGFSWVSFAGELELSESAIGTRVVVYNRDYLKNLVDQVDMKNRPWKTYFSFLVVADYVSYHSEWSTVEFNFFDKYLYGREERLPPWRESLAMVKGMMPVVLGKLFIERLFSPEDRARVEDMAACLKSVFRSRLENNGWMLAATKRKAISKLDRMVFKIGYPDAWPEEAPCEYTENVIDNLRIYCSWLHRRDARFIGTSPVSPGVWERDDHVYTVNAYYFQNRNEIVIPAGILQAPFYSPHTPIENMACTGFTIGHEMTHGFDDEGRKYGGDGNMRFGSGNKLLTWWEARDVAEFERLRSSIADAYREARPRVNADLTAGENIADIGGLFIAEQAFREFYLRKEYFRSFVPTRQLLKRFYEEYAKGWRAKNRPEREKELLTFNEHCPEKHRVNVVLSLMQNFYPCVLNRDPTPKETERLNHVIW